MASQVTQFWFRFCVTWLPGDHVLHTWSLVDRVDSQCSTRWILVYAFTMIVMYMWDIKEIINQLLMSDVRRFTVDIHHEDLVSHCHSCCFCYCCQCGSSFLQADAWSRRAISSSWCMPWWTCLYLSSRRVSSNDYFSHKKLNFSIY